MHNAENVPPVYETIWQCDGVSERNPKGDSRFFSSTDGTDAEQQKVKRQCFRRFCIRLVPTHSLSGSHAASLGIPKGRNTENAREDGGRGVQET